MLNVWMVEWLNEQNVMYHGRLTKYHGHNDQNLKVSWSDDQIYHGQPTKQHGQTTVN